MTTRKTTLLAIGVVVAVLSDVLLSHADTRRRKTIDAVDFGRTVHATIPVYDARLTVASPAHIKAFRIPIRETTVEIASGVKYHAWTFGGTVPGPVLRVRVGDEVRISVVNESPIPHSIDFHAARIPANVAYRMILPHDSIAFSFIARDAGAFMVHCGTPPVLMHLMQGMYLPIIVDPSGGWPTAADKEFVIVQSEFYSKGTDADWSAALAKNPSYVVFNGNAFQYKSTPLQVNVGDRVRFFVLNAGPNATSDFHVVGAIFDRVYPDGDPSHALTGVQTYAVPAGSGAVFETVFDREASGEGLYPFVTHSFADAEKGAVGIIRVGSPKFYATMSH
ncbi:MAG TPA: multicopper oxidase domain-containing protein [Gemmatimonadaceae bacterium]|nr:multicopper oxidase domain-containing protein [Gemmatimonadaceae bacterium]